MNTTLRKALSVAVLLTWWLGSSGCAGTQPAKTAPARQGPSALFDEEMPAAAIGTLIDAETFIAFCDRA
ncbi:MAG: hypothetical protein FJ147_18445 [Deltaproteobacteria bacterium]|nr:hypothetical protein [Deltaproteobacteria bacterium]